MDFYARSWAFTTSDCSGDLDCNQVFAEGSSYGVHSDQSCGVLRSVNWRFDHGRHNDA